MMKLLIMADQKVGFEITRWLLNEYLEDVALIVVTSENEIWEEVLTQFEKHNDIELAYPTTRFYKSGE